MTDTNTVSSAAASRQALWFLVVGALAAGVHFVVLVAIVSTTTVTPVWANVLAFLVAFVVSFLGHYHLTFKQNAQAIDSAVNNNNNTSASDANTKDTLKTAVCTEDMKADHVISCNNNTPSRLHHSNSITTDSRTTPRAMRGTHTPTKPVSPLYALLKWFASSALGFMANQALFVTGLHWLGAHYYMLVWLVVTGMITIMTFALGKLWAFKS
ncbi:GtrA family protein [Psychrobacter sp. Ps4]|uniref:GtrA family protein n=1 Tax=Psychrobacter sp. Ps4 TaxID=2790958 RepID=UPI001EDEA113|nr:GtrA family protein [Psychrobacter sp. Ps4]MCG3808474.1 GtrA family protein [Psychrobacter sp. Ps4]